MITILGPHSCSTDLSMMMLPAGQTMGLASLCNVLVPGQGCVAYLTRQNYWLLSSNFIMLVCICVFNVNTNICFCIFNVLHRFAYPTQQTYCPLSSPGEILSFGCPDDRPTYFEMNISHPAKYIELKISNPAAEMFQVVGSPLCSSVLGWEDQLVASIAPVSNTAQCTNTY